MPQKKFKALVSTRTEGGEFVRAIRERSLDELPSGDVLVKVHYSSLNYKDALSATGVSGVTKTYPHTPGVDAAGVVEESTSDEFFHGDEVIATGYDLGTNIDGGFAEYIRVPADWLVKLPENLTLRESMVFGTAGYTAGLGVYRLQQHRCSPDRGPMLVTGATGGVGCVAVAILSTEGFHVVAATGKIDEQEFLKGLGAREVIRRDELKDSTGKPLLSGRWAGGIDTVGGEMLDTMIRQTKLEGAIACCGNVISAELHTSIYPFILRGVSLIGINSAFTPMDERKEIWNRLSTVWKMDRLEDLVTEVSLDELDPYFEHILRGNIRGRIVVNLMK